jgi:hypothetical protein
VNQQHRQWFLLHVPLLVTKLDDKPGSKAPGRQLLQEGLQQEQRDQNQSSFA